LGAWREKGEAVSLQIQQGRSQTDALNELAANARQNPAIRFVAQSELPPKESYESYIFRTGCCPTRDGIHDFLNGLAWVQFPRTKRQLNRLHMAQIQQQQGERARGVVRDGLTVFDENAAFLIAPDVLWDALHAKSWTLLFGKLRPLWSHATLILFGHALMEKLVSPRKNITAHVYRVQGPGVSLSEVDAKVAATLSPDYILSKPYAHLPILGVPGWWLGNESAAFYHDSTVFRLPKQVPLK
jgi:hypothetical protein